MVEAQEPLPPDLPAPDRDALAESFEACKVPAGIFLIHNI
jgi:hypothetical protein